MIVRLDLERRYQPIADVHDAGIFPRALHHQLAAGRQALQMHFARFVRAVLAPHHAEDAQLRDVRIAPEDFLNARIFFARYAMLRRDFRRHFDFGLCCCHLPLTFNS